MDLNKKQAIYLIVFFLLSVVNAFGQSIHLSGRILQQKKQTPVEFATVILFRQDSVFLKGTTTDSIGRFEFENLQMENYVLSVSCLGFETKRILIQNLAESAQIDVFLNETILSLGEVVVSASSTISKINQRIVFPTKLQRSHSANGMQLLNTMMLPGLNVNPMLNTISSSDGGNVVLQVNGVNATTEEIQTLQPHQIKRIEYSDYVGIRYGQASKIVNYIVKRDDKGGVVGIDLMNSLNILAGGDVLFAKFNKGKSEYAINYTIVFQDINTNNRTRTSYYQFKDIPPLLREEINNGGDYSYQKHDVSLAYNYQQNDSTFFNAEMTLKVGMIKNFLQFSFTAGFNHFNSRGNHYSQNHSNFYYRADLLAMYKKWMFIAQLQPFNERLEEETIIKDGNYHYLAIQYNASRVYHRLPD